MISIDFNGKTALVTGGGQGLGAATLRRLIEAGARVAINYLPDADGANKARAETLAAELGDRAATFPGDVRDLGQMERLFDEVEAAWGKLDFAINNAGLLRDRTIRKMDTDDWRDVLETNLTGVFHVCKTAAERLADGGRIVNVGSISGAAGFFGQGNYAAAKAGVGGLTRVLSRELAPRRITVNAVAPGVVLTEMGKSIPEKARARMLEQIPLGRFGEAREIADVIVWLCSDLAAYVTGQTVHVNGGWWPAG